MFIKAIFMTGCEILLEDVTTWTTVERYERSTTRLMKYRIRPIRHNLPVVVPSSGTTGLKCKKKIRRAGDLFIMISIFLKLPRVNNR